MKKWLVRVVALTLLLASVCGSASATLFPGKKDGSKIVGTPFSGSLDASDFRLKWEGDWTGLQDSGYRTRLEEVFAESYPMLYARFGGKDSPKTVTLALDSKYSGTAYTSGDKIVVGLNYADSHPEDMGFFVHELTHCVQYYGNAISSGSSAWWTENMANYARFRYYHWMHQETIRVYTPKSSGVANWNYKPYGSCEWFFAWMDSRYPTTAGKMGMLNYGLVDSINRLNQDHEGSPLNDSAYDNSTAINALVKEFTGSATIEELRKVYEKELLAGTWSFTGFGGYKDNFITDSNDARRQVDYPALQTPSHGSKTARPETAVVHGNNLARNAKVLALSGQINDRESGSMLVDGFAHTKWCCTVSSVTDTTYCQDGTVHWILLDLGKVQEFDTYTILNTATKEPGYGNMTSWELLASEDGSRWKSLDYQKACYWDKASFPVGQQQARYILLRIYDPDNATDSTIRLYEFMLFDRE